jgi:hypothetical protein
MIFLKIYYGYQKTQCLTNKDPMLERYLKVLLAGIPQIKKKEKCSNKEGTHAMNK